MGKYKKTIKTIIEALNNGAKIYKVEGKIVKLSRSGKLCNAYLNFTSKEEVERDCDTCRFASHNNGLNISCGELPGAPYCIGYNYPGWEPLPKGKK